jgi:hypothetical protein
MKNPTLAQASHLIQLVERKKPTLKQLQLLFNSGFLTDVLRAAIEVDLAAVDREAVQKALGLDPTVFKVLMGCPETTDDIVRTLLASRVLVNEHITQANLPLHPREMPDEDVIELVDPGRKFSFDACGEILTHARLDVPAYEHALRFAHRNTAPITASSKSRKSCIVFPHKSWFGPDGNRYVISVDCLPGDHMVDLHAITIEFGEFYLVAGVRPKPL